MRLSSAKHLENNTEILLRFRQLLTKQHVITFVTSHLHHSFVICKISVGHTHTHTSTMVAVETLALPLLLAETRRRWEPNPGAERSFKSL